jgi:5'-methylthioadenosine/S-adenosylhomocysteine nucleosidase
MIALIGAMEEEIQEFLRHTKNIEKTIWKSFIFYQGELENKKVIIVKCGVGKVLASMLTQKLIDTYKPSKIIFTGIAGGLDPAINIGDVVVAKQCVQHDMDCTAMGFKIGAIPYTNWRFIDIDSALSSVALKYISTDFKIFHGNILTGDQFMTHKQVDERKYLRDDLEGIAIEMEGAAVSMVAMINEIPCLIIRTISDKADSNATVDFQKFVPIASLRNYQIVEFILKNL